MRTPLVAIPCLLAALGCATPAGRWTSHATSHAALDTHAIEQALGVSGTMSDGVFKVTYPRADIRVSMDGFPITPRMGLTAWWAFAPHGHEVMVMGDIPLLADELHPVLSALMDNGLEVSALHNHFVGEEARVMFLHVGGMGDPVALAQGLRKALDAIQRVRAAATPLPPASEVHSELNTAQLETLLGAHGDFKDGVYKVTIPRPAIHVTEVGVAVNSMMGFNSWAAFQGTTDHAAVSGDFAMPADEVNPVVRALRRANIHVVAIHNHMLREQPRIFFLHFWGVGRAEDLATGLRAALDQMSPRMP